MITFDPQTLSQPATQIADAVRGDVSAAAVVAQVTRGGLTVQIGSGVADLDRDRPAPAQGAYEIGSQTKMMTSVMILQLVEDGLIDLDARAADYLPPEVTQGIANADQATVRQLLNMTAGIGNYTEAVNAEGVPLFVEALLQHPDQVFGPEQALAIARDMDPTGEPGESYYYSNTNYLLLGQMFEGLTGQGFYEALKQRVLDPAGMEHSVRQLTTGDERLHSYATLPDGTEIDVTRALWEMQGEAGVVSTNGDMTRFLQALLVDKTLLGEDALSQMTDFFKTDVGPGYHADFGLGLVRIVLDDGPTFIGFSGGTLGTGSSTYLDLATGAIVSVAGTNADVDTVGAPLAVWQASQGGPWERPITSGAVEVASGSAREMKLDAVEGGMTLSALGATLTVARDMRTVTTQNVHFADGSVLLVGDLSKDTSGDDLANRISVARDAIAAMGQDNHLMGLGGNDALRGGDGADWLQGGKGRDVLRGGAGDDLLQGGAGADIFVFRAMDAGHDILRDFRVGQDRLDLTDRGTVTLSVRNGNTILTDGDLTLVLQGVSESDLAALVF